ncbi:MAG: WG repeat-containing protein [Clostridia bacterium]|nr:WG repeat-containing protein [Clostridia bacterium]
MRYFYNTETKYLSDCKNGAFIATVGQYRKALINPIGRISDDEYYEIEPRLDGYFTVRKNYKSESLMDKNGNIVYADAKDIDLFTDDDIALVDKLDGTKRWITKTGFEFGSEYKDIGCFTGGYGLVQNDDDTWSYVDRNLQIVSGKYEKAAPFFNKDFAWISQNGQKFVINKKFEVLSGPYESILWIEEDGIVVTKKETEKDDPLKYAYFTVEGKQIGPNFKMIHGFENGFSRVDTGEGYNFVDLNGNLICEKNYIYAENFGEDYAVVGGFDEKGEHTFTFIGKDGKEFGGWHPVVSGQSEGIGYIYHRGKNYYVDGKGKVLSKGFKGAHLFSEGRTYFESSKGKYQFMTKDFQPIGEEFDRVSHFSEGWAVVRNGEVEDAVNKKGLKLSQISQIAEKIEQNPIVVLNLPKEIVEDKETSLNLANFAYDVLSYLIEYGNFDDLQKQQFESDRNSVKMLIMKIKSEKANEQGFEAQKI